MQRDQTPPQAPERLLDLHGPGQGGLRGDSRWRARPMGCAGPEQAAAADAGTGADAGRAQGVEANAGALSIQLAYVVTWRYYDGSGGEIVSVHGRKQDAERMLALLERHAEGRKFEVHPAPSDIRFGDVQ